MDGNQIEGEEEEIAGAIDRGRREGREGAGPIDRTRSDTNCQDPDGSWRNWITKKRILGKIDR